MTHHIHLLLVGGLRFRARVLADPGAINVWLSSHGKVGDYDEQTRDHIDAWFFAIVNQWPFDPRTVCVMDPQHIMTTA